MRSSFRILVIAATAAIPLVGGLSHPAKAQTFAQVLAKEPNSCWRSSGLYERAETWTASELSKWVGPAVRVETPAVGPPVMRWGAEVYVKVPCPQGRGTYFTERAFIQFAGIYAGRGLSISGSFGGAQTVSNFSVFDIFSAGTKDETTPNFVAPLSNSAFGGFNVAVTSQILSFYPPEPEEVRARLRRAGQIILGGGRPAPQGPLGVAVGAEGGIDWFGNNSATIQGLPGSPFVPATNNDSFIVKTKNASHVAGVIHVPIGFPQITVDAFGKVGIAWVDRDVTYNCSPIGFCGGVFPATPAFSATQSTTQSGLYWGGGIGTAAPFQIMPGLPPPIISFEFDQIHTGEKAVTFGDIFTRQVSASVGTDRINMFRFSVTQPLGWWFVSSPEQNLPPPGSASVNPSYAPVPPAYRR